MLRGGQTNSITFMPGDVPHMHSVSSVPQKINITTHYRRRVTCSIKCIGAPPVKLPELHISKKKRDICTNSSKMLVNNNIIVDHAHKQIM